MTGLGVELRDLTLRYGATVALDRVDLTLAPGRIYGLIGRSGSGKSSLLSVLAAFRRPSSGTVRVDGEDPFEHPRLTRQICLVGEDSVMIEQERCDRILSLARTLRPGWDQAYAEHLAERFELPLTKTSGQLSQGQRSALACVLGLASRAPLTMFDESHLGMDAPARYLFYEELLHDCSAHPRTIILTTHLVEEFAPLFEEVVMLHRGRVLVHEEVDAVRAQGATVTGPKDLVDRFATGRTVLAQRRLGDTSSVTLYGTLSEAARRGAVADGLRLEPVPLQDLFVHLTKGEGTQI